ncbi:hypothetical protein COO91_08504 [Nostoc flagelliforme CCNUN1]|uniref:Uncharacterized protein n=1 Tax=Nostoc flagelliforme CCNUN1 TaxID=2038116 RepID=A0A2K8T3Z4_9NOSO|nr:hypothetical protein COO91_08504 [Nostoc flagelliforme CCNUN1]
MGAGGQGGSTSATLSDRGAEGKEFIQKLSSAPLHLCTFAPLLPCSSAPLHPCCLNDFLFS